MKQPAPPRERLIEAARQLFAGNGFDATSVRDITARAHANLGAITYHFGSKEALYLAVLERFVEPIADQIAAISRETGPALDRLATAVTTFLDHLWRHPEMPRLILREMASDRPLPEPIARVIQRNAESFTRIVADGQADGSIRPGEPRLMAISIAGQPLFMALMSKAIRQVIDRDPSDPAVRSLILNHVITNLKGALGSHAQAPSGQAKTVAR